MTVSDIKILEQLKDIKKNGAKAQERMRAHAILLSNDGKKSQEIANILEVSQRSIFQWFKDFKTDGTSSLKCSEGRGRKRLLNPELHLKIIKTNIELYPHQPKKAYAQTLEDIKMTISYETFKRFLKKHLI